MLVAMLDSVHTARWLTQFVNTGHSFTIIPSKKFRNVHPNLKGLIEGSDQFKMAGMFRFIPLKFAGYFDYLLSRFSFMGTSESRSQFISRAMAKCDFDYIHCLEFQGAGYLIREIPRIPSIQTKIIVTNWGSDIYFFQNDEVELLKIKSTLARADIYSGECERDYALATKYGFKGEFLPCIPNAGGFNSIPSPYGESGEVIDKTSSRDWVVCKTYGGLFGRGDLILDEVERILESENGWNFFFYSVTEAVHAVSEDLDRYRGWPLARRSASLREGYGRVGVAPLVVRVANSTPSPDRSASI